MASDRVRVSAQELMDIALNEVPEVGEIPYQTLVDNVRALNPDAVQFIPKLKAEGKLKARLEWSANGGIVHVYSRKDGA